MHSSLSFSLTLAHMAQFTDLLNCRDTVRALLSDNRHSDVTVNVEGKSFNAHRAILAKRCMGFSEAVPVGTTADAYSAFLGAVYFDQFGFLTHWKLAVGVLRLSVRFGALDLEQFCDHALAHLIPTLDIAVVLQILPVAIQLWAEATAAACIRVLCENKEVLTSAIWDNFKATEGLHVFQMICDVLLAKSTTGQVCAGDLNQFCGDGLAELIPSLGLSELLLLLPTIIQHDKLAAKMKTACIRALREKGNVLGSAAWAKFKATEGIHVFQAIGDALLTAPGLLPAMANHCAPEVTLSHTWVVPHADVLSGIESAESTPIPSPLLLEHKAVPRLKWQMEFYPRGNTQAADYKQGYASLYLKAIFGPEPADLKAVYATWNATIIVNGVLEVSIPDSSDFHLYTGAKEIRFGFANAFLSEKFDETLKAITSSFAIKLDLTVASISEILKCRDLLSSLSTDKTHADVELDVNGTVFKAHKFMLAIRSKVFADMLETATPGKVEIKDTTPEAFKAFMAAIYYENWDSDIDAAIAVLNLAERFAVADLKRYCDETLAHLANESNVWKLLPHAAIQNAVATKLACFGILFGNEEAMKSGGWEKFKTCTDVKLHVNGKIFKAHKSVLSTRSVVFARMFQGDTEENLNGRANIKKTTLKAFEVFLAGVYYESWSFLLDMDATIKVLILAERYDVADLKRYCDDTLAHLADISNVLKILPHAAKQNAEATTAACIEILFANEEMMNSSGWIKLTKDNKDIMADIFKVAGKVYRNDRQRTM